jgi:hypothetical protein
MFTRYSRVLPYFAPVSNAVGAYFVFRRLRQIFYPGRYIPSLRTFFYRSGCISLFNMYAAVLQAGHTHGLPLNLLAVPQPRWTFTPNHRRATVLQDFCPSISQERLGFIFVRRGTQVVIETMSGECADIVEPEKGKAGKVPSYLFDKTEEFGVWQVDYQGAEAPVLSCCGSGFDTASAAAMRACSSGCLTALVLRLSCDYRSAARHRKREIKMNRAIVSRVVAQRSPRIIQVRLL